MDLFVVAIVVAIENDAAIEVEAITIAVFFAAVAVVIVVVNIIATLSIKNLLSFVKHEKSFIAFIIIVLSQSIRYHKFLMIAIHYFIFFLYLLRKAET